MFNTTPSSRFPSIAHIFMAVLCVLLTSLALAWISSGLISYQGWSSFFIVLCVGIGLLIAGLWVVKAEKVPHWIVWLLIGGVALRLTLGVFWFVALPSRGYGEPVENAGYVMADAFRRDSAAWELAQSGEPLMSAFQDFPAADQYGGLLFISALSYRYIGGEVHNPLLIVVITAAFSGLGILFTWAFVRLLWGEKAGQFAAIFLALYPEAVLLGSSQMREAFTITLVASAFYFVTRFWKVRLNIYLILLLAVVVLGLVLSPPFTGILVLALVFYLMALSEWRVLRNWRVWLLVGGILMIVIVGISFAWDDLAPDKVSNPIELILWWLRSAGNYQEHLAERASGWLQRVFDTTPEWMHLPVLVAYGVVRPFLPAALIAGGTPLWRAISIWRSLGWTMLSMFLIYVPIQTIRSKGLKAIPAVISIIVWTNIIIASFRGGGDQWDNPRYRVSFASLQVALAAWVWVEQRRKADPWLRRVVIGFGLILLWFLPWYLRRYSPFFWPVVDVFKTIGLGVASAVLYWLWDWAKE